MSWFRWVDEEGEVPRESEDEENASCARSVTIFFISPGGNITLTAATRCSKKLVSLKSSSTFLVISSLAIL